MTGLVSVIIPCFNAERWIREAIDSVLVQTYGRIEIIVIDDGSTDQSLAIIQKYGEQVIWETGPNRGGNYARNRGFSLSKGEYIQFLDADDYILPGKIEKQLAYLNAKHVDVVYGDWRHQYHKANGEVFLDSIKKSGEQVDMLASLLSGWWVSPACILYRRSVVEQSGGWDEMLEVGQDRDFLLNVVCMGVIVGYQPQCDSVYRRYGSVTVSSSSQERYIRNHVMILEKYEKRLVEENKLSIPYKDSLAQSYFAIARMYLTKDHNLYEFYLQKVLSLSPDFQAQASERTLLYSYLQKILGFQNLELLVSQLKRLKFNVQSVF